MKSANLLILNGLILTLDEKNTIIERGGVAIADSRISAVGPAQEIAARFASDSVEMIDATGKVVMPGFVNAHTHCADSLFRGYVEDLPLGPWLEKLGAAESAILNPQTVALGTQLAMAEMIRSGITCALDMFWYPEAAAREAVKAGFRLMNGPIYVDFPGPDNTAVERRGAKAIEFLEEYKGHDLIVSCVQPHAAYTVSPQWLVEAYEIACRYGVYFHTHASETKEENAMIAERYGKRPLKHLDDLGLLGSNTVLAHCVHLDAVEIDLLAERGVSVAHNPVSNLKIGTGVAPAPALLRAGVRVGLGTDSAVSSNDLDPWKMMRFAALIQKGVHQDPQLMQAPEVVRLAIKGSAEALGLADQIGSLEVGKRADIILVDIDRIHLVPLLDIFAHLVYSVGRDDVSTVIIHGKTVMRERQLLTLDEEKIKVEVKQLAERIKQV